jgi:hypothetical protein
MPTIIFSPSSQPQQVEDFPEKCDRTVKGAIHVRPGSSCIVSDGEAEHLKSRGVAFIVAKKSPVPEVAPATAKPEVASATTAAAKPVAPAVPSSPPQSGSKASLPASTPATGAQGEKQK